MSSEFLRERDNQEIPRAGRRWWPQRSEGVFFVPGDRW